MNEVKILGAALHDRKAWTVISKHLRSDDLSDKGSLVYEEITRWYELDPDAQRCDPEVIQERILQAYPKHEAVFKAMLQGMEPISDKNITAAFLEFKANVVSSKLIQALAAKDTKLADTLAQEYRELLS